MIYKTLRRIYQLLLVCFILIGIAFLSVPTTTVEATPTTYLDEYGNWHIGDLKVSDTSNYYQGLDALEGQEFIDRLSDIISANVTRITYGSGTKAQLTYIERHPLESGKQYLFYSGIAGTSWNQEHTWAKSHGFPDKAPSKSWHAFSDLHHLRSTLNSINSTRSNYDFDEVENYNMSWEDATYGNKVIRNTCFEPRDAVKGDVARIMMYMDVRYTDKPNLTLNETIPSPRAQGEGHFGGLSTLLKWHNQDPVDDFERRRNEDIHEIQGNRNPFIDHPEFIEEVYGVEYTGPTGDGGEVPPSSELDKERANEVIQLINQIGTVSLASESIILEAEALYQALSAVQKKLVSNYGVLKQARVTLDRLKNPGTNPPSKNAYMADYQKSTSRDSNGYEANGVLTSESHEWSLSYYYKKGSDVRLGSKTNPTMEQKFSGLGTQKGAALEMLWDIEYASSMELKFDGNFGTISQMQIYFSIDQGNSYQLVESFDNYRASLKVTLSQAKTGRFALVIIGSDARLKLGTVDIQCLENISATEAFETINTKANLLFQYKKIEESFQIQHAAIRFGVTLSQEIYNGLLQLDVDAEFGALLIRSDMLGKTQLTETTEGVIKQQITPVRVAHENAREEDSAGSYYQFAFVVAEIPSEAFDLDFTAVTYVKVNGEYYYTTEKKHSFYSMVEQYVSSGDPQLVEHLEVLQFLTRKE